MALQKNSLINKTHLNICHSCTREKSEWTNTGNVSPFKKANVERGNLLARVFLEVSAYETGNTRLLAGTQKLNVLIFERVNLFKSLDIFLLLIF